MMNYYLGISHITNMQHVYRVIHTCWVSSRSQQQYTVIQNRKKKPWINHWYLKLNKVRAQVWAQMSCYMLSWHALTVEITTFANRLQIQPQIQIIQNSLFLPEHIVNALLFKVTTNKTWPRVTLCQQSWCLSWETLT